MHNLVRQVRFSINPFLDKTAVGANSHSSKPSGEALAIYFCIFVELCRDPEKDTGFVVNVSEIDKAVRSLIVPVFEEVIKREFKNNRHVSWIRLKEMLQISKEILIDQFARDEVRDVGLVLNPQRVFGLKNNEDKDMFYFAEKFEFAAMHKLWNDKFSEDENLRIFGKCSNPSGHGHNYTAEVIVELDEKAVENFSVADYQQIVENTFIDIVDHKNLNDDVEYFKSVNPTVENIAKFAYGLLSDKFENGRLDKVTIWETQRTCCSYSE